MKPTFLRGLIQASLLTALALPVFSALAARVDVQILSATVKDKKVAGANVTLQRNGEQSAVGTTNAQGMLTLNTGFADDRNSLLIVKTPGYSNLVVKCPCAGMTYAVSPVMTRLDGMRIVLNWGRSPEDLDSHLVYGGNHVYFSNKQGRDANLDVDDTTSYGPETITIQRKRDGERYLYAVHDYTHGDEPGSKSLSRSGAIVFVYVGQTLVRTYYVPTEREGNLWEVFAISESGEFIDYNTIKGVESEQRVRMDEIEASVASTRVERVSASQSDRAEAAAVNRQGEQAYHAKNLVEAIRLYQRAIDLDGEYGQAYSNLGLAFQKAGRQSEALWANRKAIALAHGSTAATVRASSHYNNARIYEAAGEWSDALREFRAAKAQKANPAYDQGIARMRAKGAR